MLLLAEAVWKWAARGRIVVVLLATTVAVWTLSGWLSRSKRVLAQAGAKQDLKRPTEEVMGKERERASGEDVDEGVWAPHLVLLMQPWDLIGEDAQTATKTGCRGVSGVLLGRF